MLTEFARDHAFTIGWFGLMAFVWFGWGQEDPPAAWRWRLGVGSGLGVLLAGVFGFVVFRRWADGSALEGRYAWFGVLVAAEVVAAGVGGLYLSRTGRGRWLAWWVAVVVAVHFVPLAFFLADASLVVLGVLQLGALGFLVRRLRADDGPTSRLVGPVMGTSLLVFAALSLVVFGVRY
ncbi:hypothetical protein [Actinophytocola sediminis]